MPLLALHGFTGLGSDFAPFLKLVGGEWQCPDLPGHGPAAQMDCRPSAHVEFIEKHRRSFLEGPHILLAYSMGARAALHHLVAYPQAWDACVLISAQAGIDSPDDRAQRRFSDERLAKRIEKDGCRAFIDFWQSTPMIRSQKQIRPDWREAMQEAREAHSAAGLAASLRQFGQGQCPSLWPELSKLSLPTLLLTGAMDIKYSQIATHLQKALAGSVVHHTIDGAGHMPHLEEIDTSADLVRKFLENNFGPELLNTR